MRLNELKQGTSAQIVVHVASHVLEFATKVEMVYDDCIYLSPITQEDKVVGFSAKGLVVHLVITDPESERAYQFTNVRIRTIKNDKGEIYHEIVAPTEAKQINRRGACRVWLGDDGVGSCGHDGKLFYVTIKDISVSGISFYCTKDIIIPDGSIVCLEFDDDSTGMHFSLAAIIVRSVEMDDTKIMYGCKLNQESNVISKFVNDKQREKLRASRQSNILGRKFTKEITKEQEEEEDDEPVKIRF